MRAVLAALVLLAAAPLPVAAQDVLVQLQNGIDLVSAAVERSFARALPLPAPSAGVSYSFDPSFNQRLSQGFAGIAGCTDALSPNRAAT